MQNAAVAKTSEQLEVLITAEEDSPGAEIMELLLGLPPEKHSDKHPIELISDWDKCDGGKMATAIVHVVVQNREVICKCFVGDANGASDQVKQVGNVLRLQEGYGKGSFSMEPSGGVTINRWRFNKAQQPRKISMAQQIVHAAVTRCGAHS